MVNGVRRLWPVRGPERSSGRRGTAMIEFLMVLPFLATIIMLIFFFGWSMRNTQRVRVASRYANWQRVQTGAAPSGRDLNDKFFMGLAPGAGVDYSGAGLRTAVDSLSASTRAYGTPAQAYGDWLLDPQAVHLPMPRGLLTHVAAEFQTTVNAWQQFTGAIHGRHTREGVEWRRANHATCREALRQLFLIDLDNTLNAVPAPADGLAQMVRRLYLGGW